MAKKILAAMLALTMCAGLAGCGKVSDNKDSGSVKEKSTAAADTNTTNDENIQAADSKTDDGSMTVSTKLNRDNIFFEYISSDCKDVPTNDELITFVESAAEQYHAIQTNDKEKIRQTIAFDKIIDPFCDFVLNTDIAAFYLGYDDCDHSLKDSILFSYGWLLPEDSDSEETYYYNADDNASADEYKKKITHSVDNMNIDELVDTYWKYWKDLVPLGELSDDTVISINLLNFERDGDDMFIDFYMTIFNGNDKFEFNGVRAWYIDGNVGVRIALPEHSDNEYAGMTVDEIEKKIKENDAIFHSSGIAKRMYDIMTEYCADQEVSGEDLKQKLDSDFPMCTSSAGLDLAGDEPQAEGDKYVYNEMHRSCYRDGKASISGYDKDLDFIEKAGYTSTDGVTGYYPTEE